MNSSTKHISTIISSKVIFHMFFIVLTFLYFIFYHIYLKTIQLTEQLTEQNTISCRLHLPVDYLVFIILNK
jgi:hypothetical protein